MPSLMPLLADKDLCRTRTELAPIVTLQGKWARVFGRLGLYLVDKNYSQYNCGDRYRSTPNRI